MWSFIIYVAGDTERSAKAIADVNRMCTEFLPAGNYEIRVVDVLEHPDEAERDDGLITPALVCREPVYRKVIGDLSDTERVAIALGLRAR